MPKTKSGTASKGEPKTPTNGAEDASTKLKPELIRWAVRDLKLRYQRIIRDIEYWERLHTSNLLDRHRKQFDGVRKSIDPDEEDIGDEKLEAMRSPPKKSKGSTKSIRSAKQAVDEFETQLADGFKAEELEAKLILYTAHADRLAAFSFEDKPGFQVSWGHFRTAIEQRMVPQYRSFLEKVDVIARDCYYPLLKALEVLTQQKLGEHGWLSPMSVLEFARFYRILSTREGPIPYIFVPFDRMDSVWNLCAIHHEVGHDFFHKFEYFPGLGSPQKDDVADQPAKDGSQLSQPGDYFRRKMQEYVEKRLAEIDLSPEEKVVLQYIGRETYSFWLEEVFADMIGVMLAGPVYINSLQEILIDENVTDFVSRDYPPTYIRISMNLIFAKQMLKCGQEAIKNLKDRWDLLYSLDKLALVIQQQVAKQQEKEVVFKAFRANPVPQDLNSGELTAKILDSTLKKWLPLLVEACWQAELAPNSYAKPINLHNIFTQIVLLENQQADKRKQKQSFEDDKKLYELYWRSIKRNIQTALDDLTEEPKPKRPSCRPRHLVSAARLAFESQVLRNNPDSKENDWEEKMGWIFFDSVIELGEVADEFEQLEQVFVDKGLSYEDFSRSAQPVISKFDRYLRHRP